MDARIVVTVAACLTAVLSAVSPGVLPGLSASVPADGQRALFSVVRADATLVPFGAIDRGRWKPAWTKPAKRVEVPIRLEDIPASWLADVPFNQTWHFVPVEGEPRDVRIAKAGWGAAFCQQHVLLETTDAMSDRRDVDAETVPSVGLAVLGAASVRAPVAHAPTSALARRVTDLLARHVDRREQMTLMRTYLGIFVHPYSRDQRATYPLEIIGLYGDRNAGAMSEPGAATFFEAVRRYPREANDPDNAWCDIVTYASGWVGRGKDGATVVWPVDLAITSCQLDSVSRRLPLGIVESAAGAAWVFQQRGTRGEAMVVVTPPGRDDEEVLLATSLGHCAG